MNSEACGSRNIATSKTDLFTTTGNNRKPFNVIAKNSIAEVVHGSSSAARTLKRDKPEVLKVEAFLKEISKIQLNIKFKNRIIF